MMNKQLYNNIKAIFVDSPFRKKITGGAIWLGFGSGSENVFRLIRNMILARLLLPDDFGLMAIILSFNALLSSVSQIGIKEAVIQSDKGADRYYLNASFWMSFSRGILLYIIAFLVSPFIGSFYNNNLLTSLIRISFLTVLFESLISPRAFVALKNMDYRKWIYIVNIGSIIGIIFTITLGLYYRNVWALVFGYIVEAFSRCLLSYIICPFFPNFEFEKESLHDLFTFMRRIFGLSFVFYVYMRIDIFVLGKLCSSDLLGIYSMSKNLAYTPEILFTSIIHPLLLSVFADIKKNKENIETKIYQFSEYLAIVFIPIFMFFVIFSSFIIKIVYGEKYLIGTLPFIIFCFTLMLKTTVGMLSSVYTALGRPDLIRFASIVRAISLILIILPLTQKFGISGAAFSIIVSTIIGALINIVQLKKVTSITVFTYLKSFKKGLVIGSIIGLPYILYLYYM